MIQRPFVTYSGDENIFHGLKGGLISSLPQETVEWRRSYIQLMRSVHVEVDFCAFTEECLTREPGQGILGFPILHTFWTDCPDIETYKGSVRETLQSWLQHLKQNGCVDWMVILVEAPDAKKTNKLIPRTTLIDKLKNDFGGKQSERYVSLIDPSKSDSRSVESWQNFLFKMRQLIMVAYSRAVNKFEESMRVERERRIEKNWSFCKYFLMQEELAQVFSLLSLNEDSLIQYDELDALFTQFILNSAAGDSPHWLSTFSQPCDKWEGLFLSAKVEFELKDKIKSKNITLLEFRNYLFHCQCALLMQLNRPWDLAIRALNFLHNVVLELKILDVAIADGGTACWGFLSCLEVINFLYKCKDSSSTDLHALHTSPLWSFARDKLKELGNLCGLLANGKTSNEQLHTVISLVYGMGEDPHANDDQTDEGEEKPKSPMTRLKEALSSQEAFKRDFLDLSEVAISTYKHIGRLRSARLIGRDLALFYLQEGSPNLAVTFLLDQLKTFLEEGWDYLAVYTQLDLIKCYWLMDDKEKLVKMCLQLSACQSKGFDKIRTEAYTDMQKALKDIPSDKLLSLPMERLFEVGWLKIISSGPIILGSILTVEVTINSRLPASIECEKLEIQLRHHPEVERQEHRTSVSSRGKDIERKCSTGSATSQTNYNRKLSSHSTSSISRSVSDSGDSAQLKQNRIAEILEDENDVPCDGNIHSRPLQMNLMLEYKQDKSLSTASINCSNTHKILRRRDSHGGLENCERTVMKETFSDCLSVKEICIHPGKNVLQLSTKISKKGSFSAGQVALQHAPNLQFILSKSSIKGSSLSFEVIHERAQVKLGKKDKEVLSGVLQSLVLTVKSGSTIIQKDTKIKLKSSRGLLLMKETDSEEEENEYFSKEIEMKLPEVKPFEMTSLNLKVISEHTAQKDSSSIEHFVSIASALLDESRLDIEIPFIPPFMSSHKLYTANLKKFIQVTLTSLVMQPMLFSNPKLEFMNEKGTLPLALLNIPEQEVTLTADHSSSYMWQLAVEDAVDDTQIAKLVFSIDYKLTEDVDREIRTYCHPFDIHNYKTLYTVRSKVEPIKGSEFCRAGNMCHLYITLLFVDHGKADPEERHSEEDNLEALQAKSVMYEVIVEQNMWAVCGRTAGVLTLEAGHKQQVVLDVMPLISGFLPLPGVRLSKYIPAEMKQSTKDSKRSNDIIGTASSVPRLEPFSTGQVYNFSKAMQVHVLPAVHSTPSESSLA